MPDRIVLVHLTFAGPAVESATVEFGPRATVIRGPSDTGKSFITDAIDFMLGASRKLDDIPERVGYSVALLGIRVPGEGVLTLARSVDGGDFGVYEGDLRSVPDGPPQRTLKQKSGAKASLSSFFLEVVGLSGKRLRKNVNNETVDLSFRALVHLCVIDETGMQAERSPVLTGVTTNVTAETAALKLILEGVDDAGLVAVPSARERRQKAAIRGEIVDGLRRNLEKKLDGSPNRAELSVQLAQVAEDISKHSDAINEILSARSRFHRRVITLENEVSRSRERLADVEALIGRFMLLDAQYSSDLARLDMISEAGSLLGYFTPGRCVFCGADVEHQQDSLECADGSTRLEASISVESRKTVALREDLSRAISDLRSERGMFTDHILLLEEEIGRCRREVVQCDEALAPRRSRLNQLLDARRLIDLRVGFFAQIDELADMLPIAQDAPPESVQRDPGIQEATAAALSQLVSDRLVAWGVPGATAVRYSVSQRDVVFDNQVRSAHGKGVRAILHAAFTLAVAKYCLDRGMPHPGFVVLDSPLVTYRPPDRGGDGLDALPSGVVERFYLDLHSSFAGQVIVLENIEPPDHVGRDWTDVVFTKNGSQGRYGFFPVGRAS